MRRTTIGESHLAVEDKIRRLDRRFLPALCPNIFHLPICVVQNSTSSPLRKSCSPSVANKTASPGPSCTTCRPYVGPGTFPRVIRLRRAAGTRFRKPAKATAFRIGEHQGPGHRVSVPVLCIPRRIPITTAVDMAADNPVPTTSPRQMPIRPSGKWKKSTESPLTAEKGINRNDLYRLMAQSLGRQQRGLHQFRFLSMFVAIGATACGREIVFHRLRFYHLCKFLHARRSLVVRSAELRLGISPTAASVKRHSLRQAQGRLSPLL